MTSKNGSQEVGFTLIELMVAVSILAVLAGVVLLNIGTFFGEGDKTTVWGLEQQQVSSAVGLYMVDNKTSTIDAFDVGPLPLGKNKLGPYLLGELIFKWHVAADGSVSQLSTKRGDNNAGSQYLVFSQSDNVLAGNMHNANWVDGLTGEAIAFNGTNSYVLMPNSAAYNPTAQVSMEAWVYSGEQKSAKVIEKGDWDGQGIDQDKYNGWQAGVYINGDKKYTINWGQGQPALNTWYHVAYTYDGSHLRLYVNGVECNSVAISGSLKVNTRPVSIGADGSAQKFFKGTIDQARIYNSALTADQILAHYDALEP